MQSATYPPEDQEVSYVGAWFVDLLEGEQYERDRWAPFVRCVISWVGEEEEWRRHPRPLFGGTSFVPSLWMSRFHRPHVEAIFVEVPRALASRVVEALQTALSVRGLLQVEQLDYDRLWPHSLVTSAWLVGDVCVNAGLGTHKETGLRVAYLPEDEAGILSLRRRVDAEAILVEAVERGVHEPEGAIVQPVSASGAVELLVVRPMDNAWEGGKILPAYCTLFDLDKVPPDFEERLIDAVSRRLARKSYRNEVLLWGWVAWAASRPRAYYAALTGTRGKTGLSPELFKDLEEHSFESGAGELSGYARPLLRWRPESGLTRFWTTTPPLDTTLTVGKTTVPLRHRIAYVVRASGKAHDLRVERIALSHVRAHESFEHRFAPRFNVLIGDNGRGKTTLLDALAMVLRAVTDPREQGESLHDDDVTERLFQQTVSSERQYPATISADIQLRGGKPSREALTRDERGSSRQGEVARWMESLVADVRRGEPIDLPLVAYYSVARAKQPTDHQALDVVAPASRLLAYEGALDGRLDPLPFQRWFKTMELVALQESRSPELLEVVRDAVRRCIEDCEAVQYRVARDEVMLRFRDGRLVPFRQLSDGYRLTLAMVADIAWRCVTLNSHLGLAALQETSGVVLIDELDLHLHPRWQRRIVADLRGAFPKLQFIATTHSPFIVQSMKANEVLSLDPGVDAEMDYQASSIEDIAEEAMGIKDVQRSRRFQEMERAAEEYYRLLETVPPDDEHARKLKARLDDLLLPFTDNRAFVAYLRASRAAKGLF